MSFLQDLVKLQMYLFGFFFKIVSFLCVLDILKWCTFFDVLYFVVAMILLSTHHEKQRKTRRRTVVCLLPVFLFGSHTIYEVKLWACSGKNRIGRCAELRKLRQD